MVGVYKHSPLTETEVVELPVSEARGAAQWSGSVSARSERLGGNTSSPRGL